MAFSLEPTTEQSRLAQIGKAAEDRYKAHEVIKAATPYLKREGAREIAPIIQEHTARSIFDQLGNGLAAYASNDGITEAPGANVTNSEMQRSYQLYGHTPSMKDIQDMRTLNTLHNIDGGTISNIPADGLSNLNIRKG